MMSSISTESLVTPAVELSEEAAENEVVLRKPPIIETILNELGFGWFQIRMIVILGVAHSTDTMETIIQAILGPSLRCDWRLSADYVALLTSLVFLGSCIGAVPLGYAADVYGRRSICLVSSVVLMYLSWLCSISPTFGWIASLRFLSGLFIGGVLTAGSSLLSELMPTKFSAVAQLITNNFDALIGVLTAAIGLGCLEGGLNWRFFVFFTTAPLAICVLLLIFFSAESPIFLYCKKQSIEAAYVLDKVARVNKCIPKDSEDEVSCLERIRQADQTEDFRISKVGAKEIYTLLLRRRPWLLPLLLCLNFCWGFIIYGGTTILPVELAAGPRNCLQDLNNINATATLPNDKLPSGEPFECCKPLRKEGYHSLLISASGGLLSLPLSYTLVALLRQRMQYSQIVAFLLTGILLFVQSFCMPVAISNILFFVTRGVAAAGSGLMGIYSSNIFQARVRSLSSGLCAAAFRVGILTAPYVGQVLLQDRSVLLAILTFALVALGGAIGSIVLPKVRNMHTAPSSSSSSSTGGSKRSLPPLRSLFSTPTEIRPNGTLPRSARHPHSPFPSTDNAPHSLTGVSPHPAILPTTTDVSLVTPTYQKLRKLEADARRHDIAGGKGFMMHEDFVSRSAGFEVDA